MVPVLDECIFDYVAVNSQYVTGDTIGKVLDCLYKIGYEPSSTRHNNLEALANAIHRDFDYMSSSMILKSCLALCYFRALPHSLIDRVFHIDFITRVEEEIKHCYSKVKHPYDL